ncbi:MAG: polyprenyl synthetase family protein, partial [Gammaproteobacteria bacterium]|nr:polyprenyl synthetase family protein [Gammaproteobacteria bacterium]
MNDSNAELEQQQFRATNARVIATLGYEREIERLKTAITGWIARCSNEMRDALDWQFDSDSKYFRPSTVFACYRAVYGDPIPDRIIHTALVIEIFHNVSLIVDDILDKSEYRRAKQTLHTRFGELKALMVSGYMTAEGFRLVADDPPLVVLFSELMSRLGVAECMQWRLRQQPLGVEDWR